jgi:hypothetical protein
MMATLGLAGLRISEVVDLRIALVDYSAAGEARRRQDRRWRARSRDLPRTATGGRRDPDRFRDRILARSVERASATPAE